MTGVLPRYAGFGAALAFAGPPIYIHAPNLYAAEYGLGLAAMGALLLGLRMLDFIQDPLLGWWLARSRAPRANVVAAFAVILGLGALALFWPTSAVAPGIRFVLALAVVFTAFSALQIIFYESGLDLAGRAGVSHSKVAGWREAGVLAGVTAACILPEIAKPVVGPSAAYGLFAVAFCGVLGLAAFSMAGAWPRRDKVRRQSGFAACWRDATLRRLLLIGLLNALPVGLTATLFLFFVQDRLSAPEHTGPALVAFFLAAAAAAPLWARLADQIGAKRALLSGMAGAIAVFATATTLGPGDWPLFYVIAIGSGAAMGADMTLLPAMLSKRLSRLGGGGEIAFGAWGFVNKASFALAAGLALPALDYFGYAPGGANPPEALAALTFAYAAAPCGLKALALAALAISPNLEGEASE